jgi:hypothetical protein
VLQVTRLGMALCGDVTAVVELIAEAAAEDVGEELAEKFAEDLAAQLNELCESGKDFNAAISEVSRRKCTTCRNPGHNKRTCSGWLIENLGMGH